MDYYLLLTSSTTYIFHVRFSCCGYEFVDFGWRKSSEFMALVGFWCFFIFLFFWVWKEKMALLLCVCVCGKMYTNTVR